MGQEMNQIEANKNENGQEVIARVGDWEVVEDKFSGFRLNCIRHGCRHGTPQCVRRDLETLKACVEIALLTLQLESPQGMTPMAEPTGSGSSEE